MRTATSLRVLAVAAAAATGALAADAPASAGGEERPVRGWLEHAHIEPGGIRLDAKLDSGARTSSIHAEILRGPARVEVAATENGAAQNGAAEDEEVEAEAEEVETGAAETDAPAEAIAEAAGEIPAADVAVATFAPLDDDDVAEEVEVEDVESEGGPETIVFRITNAEGESSTFQRRIERYVEIKNRDGTTDRRPVVEITACIAGVWVTGEVNLADREDFIYPFLVGRNMLESSGIIVDVREIYTRSARCPELAP